MPDKSEKYLFTATSFKPFILFNDIGSGFVKEIPVFLFKNHTRNLSLLLSYVVKIIYILDVGLIVQWQKNNYSISHCVDHK